MLSKTSKELINALVVLAHLPRGEWLGVGGIAQKTRAPRNYLGKMLQHLASTDLVESQKGRGGGFRLGRPPEKIRLYDLLESTENIDSLTWCALGNKECSSRSPCRAHDRWSEVKKKYIDFLQQTTIEELM